MYHKEELANSTSIPLLLEPNSILLLSGPSFKGIVSSTFYCLLMLFTEYVHAIWPKEEDVVTSTLANSSLISRSEGEILKRKERVSLVFWNL